MTSYRYRKSHCGDKTILRPSYLHNGISYTGKTTSLYWIRAQATRKKIKSRVTSLDMCRSMGKDCQVKWLITEGMGSHSDCLTTMRRIDCHIYCLMNTEKKVVMCPDSKVHGANMGPIWGRQDTRWAPCWSHELGGLPDHYWGKYCYVECLIIIVGKAVCHCSIGPICFANQTGEGPMKISSVPCYGLIQYTCQTDWERVSSFIIIEGKVVMLNGRSSTMTSSNGNIFHITGHLSGEFTGELLAQRPVKPSFDVFLDLRLNNGWVNNHEAGDFWRHHAHYDITVMSLFSLWIIEVLYS